MDFPLREIAPLDFPPLLAEITDPPKKLYVRGSLPPIDWKWLCVVGSRKFSPYGREACTHLIQGLSGYSVVIVSGLALGIDGIAHEAALRAGLPTVAVPGSGLLDHVIYPSSHFSLAQRILSSGGSLVSEFDPSWRPRPESFPQRNRIMAGLSHAVFVVEAEERSGTLITSRLATEYNRDVLTLPHSVFNTTGSGPHLLMKLGATPVRTVDDILEALHVDSTARQSPKIDISPIEKIVLSALSSPLEKEVLFSAVSMPPRDLNVLLGAMELKGLVRQNGNVIAKI